MLETMTQSTEQKFNTKLVGGVYRTVVLGVLVWVGSSIQQNNNRLVIVETLLQQKIEQLNRMETRQDRQGDQIHDIQIELSRIKGVKP